MKTILTAFSLSLIASTLFACINGVDTTAGFGDGDDVYDNADIDGERLRKRHLIAADGSVEHLDGWTDNVFETTCSFRLASDHVQRCLPLATLATYFLDADCAQRAIYLYEPLCGDPTWGSWVDVPGAECFGGGEHVAKVLGRDQATEVFYKDPLGACASTQVTNGFVVLRLAPEEPAASFVGATID